jgi:hypothetical protein
MCFVNEVLKLHAHTKQCLCACVLRLLYSCYSTIQRNECTLEVFDQFVSAATDCIYRPRAHQNLACCLHMPASTDTIQNDRALQFAILLHGPLWCAYTSTPVSAMHSANTMCMLSTVYMQLLVRILYIGYSTSTHREVTHIEGLWLICNHCSRLHM